MGMRGRVRRAILMMLASILVVSGCTSTTGDAPVESPEGTSPGLSESPGSEREDEPADGVRVSAPEGAFPSGVTPEVEQVEDQPGAVFGSESLAVAFDISAGDRQPDAPIEVSFPIPDDATNPTLVYLARWDPDGEVWIPQSTTVDVEDGLATAQVDHLSLFSVFEWVGAEIADGVMWTGEQVRDLYLDMTTNLGDSVTAIREGFDLVATNMSGWLGIRGAPEPTCDGASTATEQFELVNFDDGDQPRVFACHSVQDDVVTVKIANNRPYGMVIDRLPQASVRLETWPGMSLDSGQAAATAFYEVLSGELGGVQHYVPPGATVLYEIGVDEIPPVDGLTIDVTTTAAFVGVDLAMELVMALWNVDLLVDLDSLNCLLGGGTTLVEVASEVDSGNVLAYLQDVADCVRVLTGVALSDFTKVARSVAATVPALLSTSRDAAVEGVFGESLTLRPVGQERSAQPGVRYVSEFGPGLYRSFGDGFDYLGEVVMDGSALELTDVALAPDGSLYGTSFSTFVQIDPETLVAREIGPTGGGVNALEFLPDGRLLAASTDATVSFVDPVSGATDVVATYDMGASSGDLLAVDGMVYGTVVATGGDALVAIDLTSGSTSTVIDGLPDSMYGLMTGDDGEILGLAAYSPSGSCDQGEAFVLDPAAGQFFSTGCLDLSPGGAASR